VTDNAGAYELFLQAVHHVRLETENDYVAARQLLLQAVSRDPRFALGFVTLASTYSVMTIDGYARPVECWPQSEQNVKRALAIDPDLPDAHAEAASHAFFYRWDRSAAEREWSTALQSRRGEVQSELLLACALQKWASGQTDAALEMARTARQVDPLNVQAAVREGDLLATLGRHDEAVSTYERVIRDVPGDSRARFGLAEVRRKQGRFDEAIATRRLAHASIDDDSLEPHFTRARGEAGYDGIVRAAARQQLERMTVRAGSGGYVSPLDFGRAFAQLGDAQQAFEYLEGAFEERAAGLVLLRVDPAWDRIRSDLRFEAAIRRVGMS
jgi:tetratricopeptide (TPR) repeat protein